MADRLWVALVVGVVAVIVICGVITAVNTSKLLKQQTSWQAWEQQTYAQDKAEQGE